ncbi:MAG TPA: IS630 family transposase [bacterium]|nr:IS630 family transposase [bacterium]
MRSNDGRKLKHDVLEEIRKRAVQQVEAGESPEDVVRTLGFCRATIYNWLAKYREGGMDSLKAKPLSGRPPKLEGKHLQWLYKTIASKNPLQLDFEYALWTRDMIGELIERKYGLRLSKVSVGRLLKKLGFSPQKPLRRAYQQDAEAVKTWLEVEYPKIKEMAKKKNADIYFCDEASVRSDYHSGTTWALKGKTPVVKTTGARFGVNMVSAISPKGMIRFMIFEGKMNAGQFCEFLKRLIHKASNPIILIVDGHPVHRSGIVKKFVASTKGKLKMFYLPGYSPELNPDELVWNDLKHHDIGKRMISGPDHLKRLVISHLRSLQKTPDKIISFFLESNVRYAAIYV